MSDNKANATAAAPDESLSRSSAGEPMSDAQTQPTNRSHQ